MKDYFYDLRYQVDNTEWRARAKRDLVFRLWSKYRKKDSKVENILDFGCGSGILQEQFEKRYNVKAFGLDTSKKAISYCRKRGLFRVRLLRGTKIPYKDNYFDLVTAIDVVEHIKDDLKALDEIKRVLKKDGLAILIVPAHSKLWSTRDINLAHFRRYNKGELEKRCSLSGLKLLASKNVDFAVYFLFVLLYKLAPKAKGVVCMGMDTAMTNKFLNEVMYVYELLENRVQDLTTFPTGLSIAVVAQKDSQ